MRHSEMVDELLVGMMNVTCTLIKRLSHNRFLVGQSMKMANHLYDMCLFALKTGSCLVFFFKFFFFNQLLGPGLSSPPKCKTTSSRLMAFTLLIELCRDCKPNFLETLELLARHHTGNELKISSWDYHPSSGNLNTKFFTLLTIIFR